MARGGAGTWAPPVVLPAAVCGRGGRRGGRASAAQPHTNGGGPRRNVDAESSSAAEPLGARHEKRQQKRDREWWWVATPPGGARRLGAAALVTQSVGRRAGRLAGGGRAEIQPPRPRDTSGGGCSPPCHASRSVGCDWDKCCRPEPATHCLWCARHARGGSASGGEAREGNGRWVAGLGWPTRADISALARQGGHGPTVVCQRGPPAKPARGGGTAATELCRSRLTGASRLPRVCRHVFFSQNGLCHPAPMRQDSVGGRIL